MFDKKTEKSGSSYSSTKKPLITYVLAPPPFFVRGIIHSQFAARLGVGFVRFLRAWRVVVVTRTAFREAAGRNRSRELQWRCLHKVGLTMLASLCLSVCLSVCLSACLPAREVA
jgi:hypothetical protein